VEEAITPSATTDGYGAMLRRRLRLIVAIVAVGAPLVLVALQLAGSPSYESTTTLLVNPLPVDSGGLASADPVNVETERQIAQSTTVARRAAQILGRDDDPEHIVEQLTVRAGAETGTARAGQQPLHFTFEAATPRLAADYAEAVARAYLEYREQTAQDSVESTIASIDAQLAAADARLERLLPSAGAEGISPRVNIMRSVVEAQMNDLEGRKTTLLVRSGSAGEVISPATVPTDPAGPPTWLNQIGGLGLLMLGALAAAVVVDRRDRHVRGRDELSTIAGPVLSVIERPRGAHPAALPAPGSAQAEAYRHLAIRLAATSRRRLDRVLFVAPRGDSASEVALSLAAAVADLGDRSLLVPCEFDHTPLDALALPAIASFDRALVEQDVTDAIDVPSSTRRESRRSRGADLAEKAIVPAPAVADLWVAPGGIGVTRTGVLTSFTAMLDAADEWFDSILVSGPPVLELPNSLELSCVVDGVVLVFDPQVVDRSSLDEAVDLLAGTSPELLLGTVVVTNDAARWA
jgi:polysaccharide biosynthesis transport protein